MTLHAAFEKTRRHPLMGVLALLFLAEVLFVGWAASRPVMAPLAPAEEVAGASVTLSELTGPAIGSESAFIALCESLPLPLWIFLLASFVLLLAYNLSAALQSEWQGKQAGPAWKFELLLLFVTLGAWSAWDGCRAHPWFAFSAVKFALILYAAYLLLREQSGPATRPLQKEALF